MVKKQEKCFGKYFENTNSMLKLLLPCGIQLGVSTIDKWFEGCTW
jgi:hypothetical protein